MKVILARRSDRLKLRLSHHYLVRFTWTGAILNGRRPGRPGWSSPAAAAAR